MEKFKRRSDIDKEKPKCRKDVRKDPEYGDLEYIGTEIKNNKDIDDNKKKEYRDNLEKAFPNRSLQNLDSYDGLDQGADGACMVACLFNLINLNGKNNLHGVNRKRKPKSWKQLRSARYWSRFYKKYVVEPKSGDFGEMLYSAEDDKLVKKLLDDESFQYVPISSQGAREMFVNKDLCKNENSAIMSIRLFFENGINNNIMFGVSWNGHARVLIGYNDTEVLFADSWGDNYQQETYMPNLQLTDFFRAGFSTVSKKSFYSNVRDCIYFETSITNKFKKLSVNIKL